MMHWAKVLSSPLVVAAIVVTVWTGGSTGCSDCELKITSNDLPDAAVGVEYRFNLSSSCGGDFWFTEDSLPPGISLQSDGDLLGTPTTEGVFFFTVTVVDFDRNDETSKGFQLIVGPNVPTRTPTATPIP